jgi:hypothetical protein
VSYCEVGDRLVFLDTNTDRYFCLQDEAEAEFRKLASAGGPTESGPLKSTRPLIGMCEGQPRRCAETRTIRQSLLDRPPVAANLLATTRAILRLQEARLRFTLLGLAPAFASFTKAKRRSAARPASADNLAAALAGFRAAERMLSIHDLCLSHSYAIARDLLRRGIDAELILGVRIGPFAAHCWVQHRAWLINDRLDTVRTFTPILVL